MTVKVISDKPVRSRRVVCHKCCYELEYTGVDVKVRDVSCMGEIDQDSYIECPKCAAHVSVRPWGMA